MNLKNRRRKYKVQLLLAYAPFLATLVISYLTSLPKYDIDYKLPLLLILLIVPLLYSYILFLKIQIDELENTQLPVVRNTQQEFTNVDEKGILKEQKKALKNLATDEKELLQKMLVEDKRSDKFSVRNNTVNGLVSIDVLYMSSEVILRYQATYTISNWAWGLLKANSSYLK